MPIVCSVSHTGYPGAKPIAFELNPAVRNGAQLSRFIRSVDRRGNGDDLLIKVWDPKIGEFGPLSDEQPLVAGEDGKLQNAGFLDYRVPVASDLPMIDTVIVEVPSDSHPFGVRGVGETGIAPPLPAIANAIADATGKRLRHLPISPPKVLKAIKEDS